MGLAVLADEYIDNSEKIAARIAELEKELKNPHLSMTERLKLRRRIAILDDLRLEQRSIGHRLKTYYAAEE